MFKLLPIATIAGGAAILKVPMDDWLRLGVEVMLGLTAVLLMSLRPQQHR